MTARFDNIEAFLDDLDPDRRRVVEALRETLTAGQPQLREHVKWNSPTYTAGDVDLLTINVQNRQRQVQLILHRGTGQPEDRSQPPRLSEDEGLVRWISDIRGVIPFPDLADLRRHQAALGRVVQRWVALA